MKKNNQKKLIILKVGTNVLTNFGDGQDRLDAQSFQSIGRQARELTEEGFGVIMVSSGAITAGVLDEQKCRDDICDTVEEQRYAARGWDIVVQKWKEVIGASRVSSTLLTKREVATSAMRQKLLNVIECCLSHRDVFIVNENDCLSDDEIKFGDNDALAAALAVACSESGMFSSVQMVMLTNKNGLNKVVDDDATLICKVSDISLARQYAQGASNANSRGGMLTKVQAAHTATLAGVNTYVANGREMSAVSRAINGEIGTHFCI